ncbi:MAG: tetratricopeptide repeat protein [Candidatus Kuenenia sp.]|nr:tetratricopeptide repeat protein [Candidatus Kuenenia hertensis]
MKQKIPEQLLNRFSDLISEKLGLCYAKDRWHHLIRHIRLAANDFGYGDVEMFLQRLLSAPLTQNDVSLLANHLTVGETYFFRHKNSFEALEKSILNDLITARKGKDQRLRIWVAGCATGEEPYSIAILIDKLIRDIRDWDITILATDINQNFLKKASEGLYRKWSFRGTPKWIINKYFKLTHENKYAISPQIKEMVVFSPLNLKEDAYPSILNNTNAMDIIFCRNVFIYFNDALIREILHKFYRSLVENGWLVVSPVEGLQCRIHEFLPVNCFGETFYKKEIAAKCYDPVNRYVDEVVYPMRKREDVYGQVFDEAARLQNVSHKKADEVLPERKQDTDEKTLTLYEKALKAFERGLYKEATDILLKLYSSMPDDRKESQVKRDAIMYLLAKSYANEGKIEDALEWCNNAIKTDKLQPNYYYLRATILHEQKNIDGAIASLKQVLYLDPNFVLAHYALGNFAQEQQKLNESSKHYENALMLLKNHKPEDVLPESEGITAGRLKEIIRIYSKCNTHPVSLRCHPSF